MPSTAAHRELLAARLEAAWRHSDCLFTLFTPEALYQRPIPLRQPFIFYLGHLPAFTWNQAGRIAFGLDSSRPAFDVLFERGIDPPDTEESAPENASAWPSRDAVIEYREDVRRRLRPVLDDPALETPLLMCLEHELMHHETLLYMLLQLRPAGKRPPCDLPPLVFEGAAAAARIVVPQGRALLGAQRDALPFGWDNEFPEQQLGVPAFTIDATPVRNGEFLEFVRAGGYDDRRLWSEEAWRWKERRRHRHPLSWRETAEVFVCRSLFEEVPLERARDWPVYVTWAEANAYARMQGRRLPTEAEYHRAAYGTPRGEVRRHPWGDDAPAAGLGNFGLRHWAPTPVGAPRAGASAWGVHDLVGNGWEWTSTPFGPLPGFEPLATYPGYSADFFDGRHFVLLGGSFATDDGLIRRSFRNWFQPNYPYVFAQFRCVESG